MHHMGVYIERAERIALSDLEDFNVSCCLSAFSRLCAQADAGAEGAVSESTQAAVIPGPPGDVRGNRHRENEPAANFLFQVFGIQSRQEYNYTCLGPFPLS